MHILITRPEADAASLVAPLTEMGHRTSLAAMIDIVFDQAEPIDVTNISGFIATSRNGVRGLDHQRDRLPAEVFDLPCFAVGEATARLARAVGFETVIQGPSAARDLVSVIKRAHKSETPLLHLAGDVLAFDLKGALAAEGIAVREHVVYSTRTSEVLPAHVKNDLMAGKFDAVVVMSPRTSETFVRLVESAGLRDEARKAVFVCLSDAVAEPLTRLGAPRTVIAAKPSLRETLLAIAKLTEQFR